MRALDGGTSTQRWVRMRGAPDGVAGPFFLPYALTVMRQRKRKGEKWARVRRNMKVAWSLDEIGRTRFARPSERPRYARARVCLVQAHQATLA
jgi:hypothetical protein